MATLRLTHPPEQSIEWQGRRLPLLMTFDRVLLFLEFLEKEQPSTNEAAQIGLSLFIDTSKAAPRIKQEDRAAVMNLIYELHIKEPNAAPPDPTKPKAMDLTKDAGYIYAGFLQAYGIDLHQEIGRMTWRQFTALLGSLPASTRLREIISIRLRPIPAPTKYNQEEIAELRRLKQIYSLSNPGMDYKDGLAQIWAVAKARAKPRT